MIKFNTEELNASIDKNYAYYDSVSFKFKTDFSYEVKGMGATSIIPGQHISGDFRGKWTVTSDSILTLSIGNKTQFHFTYKIMELSSKTLRLGMVVDGSPEIFMKMDLTKQ